MIKIKTKNSPFLKEYPEVDINLANMPSDIGVIRKLEGMPKRWYYQEEAKEILEWILGQVVTECNLTVTGSVPPWLSGIIGWHLKGHPLVRSLYIRADETKQGFFVGFNHREGTYE